MFAVHRSVFVITLVVLAGCANTISQRGRLETLSAAEIERIQPAKPAKLVAVDLVSVSRDGFSPDQIIERYQQSGARLKLDSAQVAELQQRGVDKRVLDYVVQHEGKAEQVDTLTREADRDAATRDRAERARRLYYYRHGDPWLDPYPYWRPWIYPYAGYGPHRWGGGWHRGVTIGF
jgi:hypothetical protein